MRRLVNVTILIIILIVTIFASNLWKKYFSEYWNKSNPAITWNTSSNSWSIFINSGILANEIKTMPINWNLWKKSNMF